MNFILTRATSLIVILISANYLAAQVTSDSTKQPNVTTAISVAKLSPTNPSNVLSSLSGRFPGVHVTTPTGHFGGGTRVTIRGLRSFVNDNQPLFVVNGIPIDNTDYSARSNYTNGYDLGSMALDLHLWDIDSIYILTPANSAMYGIQGVNGVVEIQTRNGTFSEKPWLGIEYNSSISTDRIAIYPKNQKLFGGGWSGSFETANINGNEYTIPEYRYHYSWGPKYDPNIQVLNWNALDAWDSGNYLKTQPWVYPEHDYTYYFKPGYNYQNNVQVNGSSKFLTLRASYTNVRNSGINWNSNLSRNILSFDARLQFKQFASINLGYSHFDNSTTGRQSVNSNSVSDMWRWSQTSVDYKALKTYTNPDGSQRSWNRTSWDDPTLVSDNPYWSAYNNVQNDYHNRNLLYTSAQIHLFKWLSVNGRYGLDSYDFTNQYHRAIGSAELSGYYIDAFEFKKTEFDLFTHLSKKFFTPSLTINSTVGFSKIKSTNNSFGGSTNGGLTIPNLYSLQNSVDMVNYYNSYLENKSKSLYATLGLDYKSLLKLDLVLRNDKTQFFGFDTPLYTKSITISFIPSNLNLLKNNTVISYSKISAGFTQYNDCVRSFGIWAFWDPRLKPEKQNNLELEVDLSLFNIVNLGLSYFYQVTPNSIAIIAGFGGSIGENLLNLRTHGWVFEASSSIIQTSRFNWNVSINSTYQKNVVKDIKGAYDRIYMGARIAAIEGESFPMIVGRDYLYDNQGNLIVDEFGNYVYSDNKPLANVNPYFFGGFINQFSYKNFNLSISLDFQKGGHMYYNSYDWGLYTGVLQESAGINENGVNIRESIANGGGVLINGVYGSYNLDTQQITYLDKNGNSSSVPVKNETRIDAKDWTDNGPSSRYIFSTDYIKLRELSIGYDLMIKSFSLIKSTKISIFGRNIAVWGNASQHFDPEYFQISSTNSQGEERAYLPSVRTFGVMLNMRF
jgi:hypothetical protein